MLAKQRAKEAKAATPAKKKKKNADGEDVEMGEGDEDAQDGSEKKATKEAQGGGKHRGKWGCRASSGYQDEMRANRKLRLLNARDSVKKPKIKLTSNSTPKANGSAAPKPSKAGSDSKNAKAKPKKTKEAEEKKPEKEVTPKEPELTPEEKHQRKEVRIDEFLHSSPCMV